MRKNLTSQFIILALIAAASLFIQCAHGISLNREGLTAINQDPYVQINRRNLQQAIEDITQKDPNTLDQKKLVVTRQKPLSRKFTSTDIYILYTAAWLAQDINGKVIFQKRHSDLQEPGSKENDFYLELKPLSSSKPDKIDYATIWAQSMIKIEKQFVQSRLRILKNSIEISKEYLEKYGKVQNKTIQLQNNSLDTKKDAKENISDLSSTKNDGFPIPDSELPEQQKNQKVQNLPFCIVVPSFNNTRNNYFKRNINSILQQEYINYHVVYIDDKSEDNTTQNVIKYLKETFNQSSEELNNEDFRDNSILGQDRDNDSTLKQLKFNETRWTFVLNSQRKYALQNIYYAIHRHCLDNEIAIILDGDDALVGTQALSALNQYYKLSRSLFIYTNYLYKKQIELSQSYVLPEEWGKLQKLLKTNDQIIKPYQHEWEDKTKAYKVSHVISYQKGPAGIDVPVKALQQRKFRQSQTLLASHLLTFYVSLFKKIDKSNFVDQNNQFFKYAYDRALTLPLVELAPSKTYFAKLMLYEYSANTGINDSAQNWGAASLKIRQKPSLQPLKNEEIQAMINSVLKR